MVQDPRRRSVSPAGLEICVTLVASQSSAHPADEVSKRPSRMVRPALRNGQEPPQPPVAIPKASLKAAKHVRPPGHSVPLVSWSQGIPIVGSRSGPSLVLWVLSSSPRGLVVHVPAPSSLGSRVKAGRCCSDHCSGHATPFCPPPLLIFLLIILSPLLTVS